MLVRNYGVDHKTVERMEQIPFMHLSFNVSRPRLTTNHYSLWERKNNGPGGRKKQENQSFHALVNTTWNRK